MAHCLYHIWNIRTGEKQEISADTALEAISESGWVKYDVMIFPDKPGGLVEKSQGKEYWTVSDMCAFLRLSKLLVYQLLRDGTIPSRRRYQKFQVKGEDVVEYYFNNYKEAHIKATRLSRIFNRLPEDKQEKLLKYAEELAS